MTPGTILRTAALLALALGLSVAYLSAGRASAVPMPSSTPAPGPDPTETSLSSNPQSSAPGGSVTLTVLVTDVGSSPTPPTGEVDFTDVGAGGTFSPQQCVLSTVSSSEGGCSTSYTLATSATSTVSISASYLGDTGYQGSSGDVAVAVANPIGVTVAPSSAQVISGKSINFTVTVAVPGISSAPSPTGEVSWSDGGAGGTFGAAQCQLSSAGGPESVCSVTYKTRSGLTAAAQQVTINATYLGDSAHSAGSATAGLTVIPTQVSVSVSFAVVGSPQGSNAPVFTYVFSNQTHAVVLSAEPIIYQVDTDSLWFVPNQLGNSSAANAWNILGSPQGTAAFSQLNSGGVIPLEFVYYHQYLVDLGYHVVGGTAGASLPPFVTYTSFGVTRTTGAPGTTWVDVGTTYSYPAELPGSLGPTRWLAQVVSGTVDGPADLSPTYYHQYLSQVSYQVSDPPREGLTAPTFFGVSMGTSFNVSLASLTSRVWLDGGSQYSLTNPLAGANSTLRWYAGSAGNGTVVGPSIEVTYYQQNPISANFASVGGAPIQIVRGVSVSVLPSLSGFSGGERTNITLTTQTTTVWLDSGSSYSIPSTLLTFPTERWIARGPVTGTVEPGATASQTYYAQYLLRVSYSGTVSSAPTLNYASLGEDASSPLSTEASTVWADAGSALAIPDPAAGQRWSSVGAPASASSANMTVEFIQQYELEVSLTVTGGGLPVPSYISGVSGGQHVKVEIGAQPTAVWLDSGTSYLVPQDLLQLPEERWVAAANLTGSVEVPGAVTQDYYHQDLLNLSFTGAFASQKPMVTYTALGARQESAAGPVWADVDTAFSIQNTIGTAVGERLYASPLGGNVTAPVQANAEYFSQDLLNYTYTPTGGNLSASPVLAGVQGGTPVSINLTADSGQVWLDAGSHWEVSLAPNEQSLRDQRWLEGSPSRGTVAGPTAIHLDFNLQFLVTTAPDPSVGGNVTQGGWYNATRQVTFQAVPAKGWTLGGWQGAGGGSYTGSNATVSIPLNSPINESAYFEPSLTIISSIGGSVKYTTGPSVQSLGAGGSVLTFIPLGGNVTLKAHASFPYQFAGWSGIESSSSNPVTLSPTAPVVIQALFAPSYLEIIGLPVAVFAGSLTTYLARHSILGSGRHALRGLRMRLRELLS